MALEPFLGAGAGDDALTVAPAELGTELPLLLPKLLEALLQTAHLGLHVRVEALGQLVPKLYAPLAELVDLVVDASPLFSFALSNAVGARLFPACKTQHAVAKSPLVD